MALETQIEDAELVPPPPAVPELAPEPTTQSEPSPAADPEGPAAPAPGVDPSPPAPRPQPTKRAMAQASDSRRRRRKNALKKAVDQLKDEEEIEQLLEQLTGEKPKAKPAELAPPPPPPPAAEAPSAAAGPTDKQKAAAKAVGLFIHGLAQSLELACKELPGLKPLSMKGTVPTIELTEKGFALGEKDKQLALIEAWSPLYAEYMDIEVPKWLELGLPAVLTTVLAFGPGAWAVYETVKAAKAKEAKAS